MKIYLRTLVKNTVNCQHSQLMLYSQNSQLLLNSQHCQHIWYSQLSKKYGLKSLIHECRISTKKTTLCSKRKARTSWDIHTVTRNAHQLYDIVSSISAQKIHFARPNGDSTFIQTSHSHKMLSSLCQLSWAICSKRSPRSVLAIVQRERLFKWWWRKRCFDFGRFLHVKRVMRARWGVFASPNLITWKSVDWSGSIKGA